MRAALAILVTAGAAIAGAAGALALPWLRIAAGDFTVTVSLRLITSCAGPRCVHAPITGTAYALSIVAIAAAVATIVFAFATVSVANRGRAVPVQLRRALAAAGALVSATGLAAVYTVPEPAQLGATWGVPAGLVATVAAIAGFVLTGRSPRAPGAPRA